MTTRIRIDVSPHPGQRVVHQHPARFKVLAAGRRWGKTRLGVNECLDVASRGGRAWWVAPSYKMSEVGWRPVRSVGAKVGADIHRVDRQIILPSGGEVTIRSADNPDSLRGEGLDFLVIDECAFIQEEAWTDALRPALSDRRGKALFISTPKGRNWFWRLWQVGQASEDDTISWRFPTSTNPYIDPAEIEAARQSLPEMTFRQEYLAEFLEGEGAVFRNIYACLHAPQTTPEQHQDHQLVAGVDWGKLADYTAISLVCKDCRAEVAHDRFNQIDYHVQRQRLRALCERWGVINIQAEANAMGEPVIEELQREGMPVSGFQTTATTKPPLVESLALAFEKEECQWLADPVWTGELEAYEMKTSSTTGRPSYSAPEGLHDDTVMARALAWYAVIAGIVEVESYNLGATLALRASAGVLARMQNGR